MPGPAIMAALLAAMVAAAAWAAVSYVTGYEKIWMSVGAGVLVGAAARWWGGRGVRAALVCGAIGGVAIVGGKVLTARLALPGVIAPKITPLLQREAYDEMRFEAEQFASMNEGDDVRIFMIAYGYTQATEPHDILGYEVDHFFKHEAPSLRRLHAEKMTYEQWRLMMREKAVNRMVASISVKQIVKGFSWMDWVMLATGVLTAFALLLEPKQAEPTEPAQA